MKIAVYTIAKNEEAFVERWYESAKAADLLLIADTGSADNTVAKAEALGITVVRISVIPWRFDDARNAALAAIPADVDYCIALDMDEVLVEGWREELEKLDPDLVGRPRYEYTWSWTPDGKPGLQYGGDKIHRRIGFRWKHPVHETLVYTDSQFDTQDWTGLKIQHHPDETKSRGQYFPLLELAVREDPEDDRNTYYLAREYFFHDYKDKATTHFKRHLSLPKALWRPERAASMRYLAKLEPIERESWLLKAIAEAPEQREARCDLAQHYQNQGQWLQSYAMAYSALEITEKPLVYLCEHDAWSFLPHDLIALAAFKLGKFAEALQHGRKAAELAPYDKRLSDNLEHYEGAVDEQHDTARSLVGEDGDASQH